MYRQLQEINSRPAPFSKYTAAELWTDAHTSSRMLAYHLDESADISSRNRAFIDRSARWIVSHFGLDDTKRMADFGCGPGLYTNRLAASGAAVTGIDFSKRSLRYACQQSQSQGLSVDYIHADYLMYESENRFDLITMIMCDFCALGPDQRQTLLDKFCACLKPGGRLLLDVFSLRAFEERDECAMYAQGLLDGFWSSAPYFGFLNTFKYVTEKVVLDKYTIVEAERTRTIYNWLQYYDRDGLQKEIEGRGLEVETVLGDVAGGSFSRRSGELAVVALKPDIE